MKKLLTLCAAAMPAVTGCATIVRGSAQDIAIDTAPAGALYEIRDNQRPGQAPITGTTPATVSLRKGAGYFKGADYTVVFSKPGYLPSSVEVDSSVSGWYIGGNALIGGVIGYLAVDPATGAMWKLQPERVQASLIPLASAANPVAVPAAEPPVAPLAAPLTAAADRPMAEPAQPVDGAAEVDAAAAASLQDALAASAASKLESSVLDAEIAGESTLHAVLSEASGNSPMATSAPQEVAAPMAAAETVVVAPVAPAAAELATLRADLAATQQAIEAARAARLQRSLQAQQLAQELRSVRLERDALQRQAIENAARAARLDPAYDLPIAR